MMKQQMILALTITHLAHELDVPKLWITSRMESLADSVVTSRNREISKTKIKLPERWEMRNWGNNVYKEEEKLTTEKKPVEVGVC